MVWDWLARAMGAFYVFAGVILFRAWRMNRFLDSAIAALDDAPTPPDERVKTWASLAIGVLTLLSGALFLVLHRFAPAAFVACAAVQGAYLIWAAKAAPPQDALEARGRRQTINAFIIYLAATAFSLWMLWTGRLRTWPLDS